MLIFSYDPLFVAADTEIVYEILTTAWNPSVLVEVDAVLGISVSTEVESNSSVALSSDTYSSYSLRVKVDSDLESLYGISTYTDITAVQAIRTEKDTLTLYRTGTLYADFTGVYTMRGSIYSDTGSTYDIIPISSDVLATYGMFVTVDIDSVYNLSSKAYSDTLAQYNMVTVLTSDLELLYDINGYNSVFKDVDVIYNILTGASEYIVYRLEEV